MSAQPKTEAGAGILEPDFTEAQRFLSLLDEEAERFTFQTFDDDGERDDPSLTRKPMHGTLEAVWSELAALNRRGAGVFVCVNETDFEGRKLANIKRVRCVWQEDDGAGKPLPLEPQIVVSTSPGKHHRYLLVDGLSIDQHAGVMERVTQTYGNDANVKDAARVLRLPGFYNCKPKYGVPHLVHVVQTSGAQPYTAAEVLTALPPMERQGTRHRATSDDAPPTGGDLKALEWLRALATGENLHGSLRDLSARWVVKGLASAEIQEALTTLARASKAADDRPQDLKARIRQIPELIASARENFTRWPDPIDPYARAGMRTVDLDRVMPASIARLARSEGERLMVDPLPVAGFCLAVCSAALSDRWQIQMKIRDTAWRQHPRLWVANVSTTGTRKTEQRRAAMSAVHALEARWREQFAEQMEQWNALPPDEQSATPKPTHRRLRVNDATIEKLSDLLSDRERHPETTKLLSEHDELAQWFGSMDAYSKGKASTKHRSDWLAAYEGGPRWIDRVHKGSTFVPNWSLVVMGGIQPGVLADLLKNLNDEGLPQRFMFLVPSEQRPIPEDFDDDIPADPEARDRYQAIVQALADLAPPVDTTYQDDRVVLVQEAQPIRREVAQFCRDVGSLTWLPSHLRNAAPKWEGLHARLTLLYHAIDLAERQIAGEHLDWRAKASAGVEAARLAGDFIKHVVWPHARRFYCEILNAASPENDDARWLSDHMLARADLYQERGRIERRDIVMQYQFKGKTREHVDRVMRTLADWCWVRPGATDARWDINPKIWPTFAERAEAEQRRRAEVVARVRAGARGDTQKC